MTMTATEQPKRTTRTMGANVTRGIIAAEILAASVPKRQIKSTVLPGDSYNNESIVFRELTDVR